MNKNVTVRNLFGVYAYNTQGSKKKASAERFKNVLVRKSGMQSLKFQLKEFLRMFVYCDKCEVFVI